MGSRTVDEDVSVRTARARLFRELGAPADGGYEERWQEAEFGPVRYRVPGSAERSRALRVHDLHHVATGYTTDWRGEAEISAFELASGVGIRRPYAWIIVLFGVFTGLVANLRPTLRAFARGRRSQSLYGHVLDGRALEAHWLDRPVRQLRTAMRLPTGPDVDLRPGAWDYATFVAWSVVALAFGVAAVPFVLAMVASAALRTGCPFTSTSCSVTT